MTSEIQNVPL